MSENLKLWDAYSTPDLQATKKVKLNGHDQTSISGYWFFKAATEAFGLCGIGWGYDVLEERLDIGAPIKTTLNGVEQYHDTKIHTIKIKLWFIKDGKKGEVVQYGHTKSLYKSSQGIMEDAEAPKKSLTDAIKKALSMLGFASDVFLGMFDDQDYLNTVTAEQRIEKAETKEAEIESQREELQAKIMEHLNLMDTATSLAEAKGILKYCRTLETRRAIPAMREICERGIAALNKRYQAKEQALKGE